MRKTGIRRLVRDWGWAGWGGGVELELVEATGWPRLCSGAADKLDQKTAEEAVADPLFSFLCVFVVRTPSQASYTGRGGSDVLCPHAILLRCWVWHLCWQAQLLSFQY